MLAFINENMDKFTVSSAWLLSAKQPLRHTSPVSNMLSPRNPLAGGPRLPGKVTYTITLSNSEKKEKLTLKREVARTKFNFWSSLGIFFCVFFWRSVGFFQKTSVECHGVCPWRDGTDILSVQKLQSTGAACHAERCILYLAVF